MSDISRRSFLSAAAASGSLPAVSAAKASQKFDLTTDVLIAGGGAAGCMAAVEAAKKVLLVQAGAMLGGGQLRDFLGLDPCCKHRLARKARH